MIWKTGTRVHGEVVISTQPRWICDANALDSDISNVGTPISLSVNLLSDNKLMKPKRKYILHPMD